MTFTKGKEKGDRKHISQKPRTSSSSSLIVEADTSSNTNAAQPTMGASPTIHDFSDEEDLEVTAWEQTPNPLTSDQRDYILRGITGQIITHSAQEQTQAASQSSATAADATQSHPIATCKSADKSQTTRVDEHVSDIVGREDGFGYEEKFGDGGDISTLRDSHSTKQLKHTSKTCNRKNE